MRGFIFRIPRQLTEPCRSATFPPAAPNFAGCKSAGPPIDFGAAMVVFRPAHFPTISGPCAVCGIKHVASVTLKTFKSVASNSAGSEESFCGDDQIFETKAVGFHGVFKCPP